MTTPTQKLPRSGPEREVLREKGQFWTPSWVAEAMVEYALGGGADHVFDPAVGAGEFFRATKRFSIQYGRAVALLGTELDSDTLLIARQAGLGEEDLIHVDIRDFVLDPPNKSFDAIVANPPYIRHHRLPIEYKAMLKAFSHETLAKSLDGRAGIHVYFLIRALLLLSRNGRLAFIMPADTCEGVFAGQLWRWITANYCLEAIIAFTPDASPFPNVDTNPLVFMIRNTKPEQHLLWAKCLIAGSSDLKEWVSSRFRTFSKQTFSVTERQLSEALSTGLSRTPLQHESNAATLGDFADVMRGIATGANDFFFLTREKASSLGIPEDFLLRAVGRTRDVKGDEVTSQGIYELEKKGRPTRLFSPGAKNINYYPVSVRKYLELGQELGLPQRALIATRRPWYKMETRETPPILFAYLGRRSARFVRNYAGVVPLTGFLCVFPKIKDPDYVDKLWLALRHPMTIRNLPLVGKSYGSGAIKVEPRALEKLPIPKEVLTEVGLSAAVNHNQLLLRYRS